MGTADVGDDRPVNLNLRVTPAFMAWVDRLADRARVSRTILVEHGLCVLAEQYGFDEPAPKRSKR